MTSKLKTALLATVFILGCTNLAYELIILRQLVNFMGSNTILTSVVMAFILLFLSLGYYVGSIMSVAKFSIRKICLILMLVLTIWYAISASYYIIAAFFHVATQMTQNMLALIFVFSAIALIVPAMMAGLVTALIGRVIHRSDTDYTGRFMAVDTIGSVLGSIGTTLVLMPFIGVSKTIFVMSAISAVAIIILSRKRQLFHNTFFALCALILCYCINGSNIFIKDDDLIKDDAISRLKIVHNDAGSRMIVINGQYALMKKEPI